MEKLAAQLCNVFGYINATEDDVIILKSSGGALTATYILIDLYHVIIEFRRKENIWQMREV